AHLFSTHTAPPRHVMTRRSGAENSATPALQGFRLVAVWQCRTPEAELRRARSIDVRAPVTGAAVLLRGLRAVDAVGTAGTDVLHHDGNHRQGHDHDDDRLEIVPNPGDLTQEVAHDGDTGRPDHGSDRRVGEVPAGLHPADPGDRGDEGAHDRDEPGEDDRARPVTFEGLVGRVDVLLFEQLRVGFVEQRGPDGPAYPVATHVPTESAQHQ